MATSDQAHWDDRYRSKPTGNTGPYVPAHFAPFADLFASAGDALEIACGTGSLSVWLALQGVHATGYDISPVAIAQASKLANDHGVGGICNLAVADFDDGVPPGDQVDLVVCNMFRDPRLDAALTQRLRPGGLLAVAALSEVGAAPGRFRARAGELVGAFQALDGLDIINSAEGDGLTWLIARRMPST